MLDDEVMDVHFLCGSRGRDSPHPYWNENKSNSLTQ